jgi:carbamoyl-phosphate synthase small subunit
MKYITKSPAILLLKDGTVFHGKAAGKKGTATGEICFNTGMTGYQEIFTDPSYFGQMLVATHVHIGNYGIHKDEVESDSMKISGLICKSFNVEYSRPAASSNIEDYFAAQNVIAISDVDTRAIVRHIRDKGAMNAIISSEILDVKELKKLLDKVPDMEGLELSSLVSTKKPYFAGDPKSPLKVAVLDLGVKKNIVRCLAERGCYCQVFPYNATLAEMEAWNPDGFMISNGPGDPGVMKDTVALVKEIINADHPVFGICLGHQIIAETQGIRTYKLHCGHRGINHPVKNKISGKSEITSQNHGFGVVAEDVTNVKNVEITHVNLNDGTIEGLRLTNKHVFTVQYHPEASPGPHDSRYLFDQFIEMMNQVKSKAGKKLQNA